MSVCDSEKSKIIASVKLAHKGTRARAHKTFKVRMKDSMDKDGIYIYIALVHDSGSDSHLTNVKGVLQNLISCNINVYGINGDSSHKPLHASEQGSATVPFSNDHHVMVDEVLYLPFSALGSSVDEPTLLLSTRKLAKQGIGTHFVAGGDVVRFDYDGEIIGEFKTESNDGLYVNYKNIEVKNRYGLLSVCNESLQRLRNQNP